jgi:starvation-inducible outer membrane lipoprotein
MKLKRLLAVTALLFFAAIGYAGVAVPTPEQSLDDDLAGPAVVWLGEIIRVIPGRDDTCFMLNRVQATDVGVYAQTATRFVACSSGSFDEDVYSPGKVLRVEGNLGPEMPRRIGGQEMTVHLVAAPYLTPQPDTPTGNYSSGYYGGPYGYPYYDPWYPGGGLWFGYGYHRWRR